LPVLFLFSSRNNILTWWNLTGWSHSTYLLLHRWIARLFLIHVVVHSIAAFQVYRFYENTDWWYWGIVGTVLTVVLGIGSGLYVRRSQYELFLISHVVMTVLVLVGSWYHLIGWYAVLGKTVQGRNTYGYEIWLYFAFAVWGFDRLVRVARVVRWGVRRAVVTEVGGGYVRVDVPGVRWGGSLGSHVFVYFPTARPWTPWENHPFSVVPTYLLGGHKTLKEGGDKVSPSPSRSPVADEEKQLTTTSLRATTPPTEPNPASASGSRPTTAGITLFIRKSAGITTHLKTHNRLLTFLEGPYASIPSSSVASLLKCDRLLIVAGGIGITGALPWVYGGHPNAKLVWSVKEANRGLVDAIDLSGVVSKEVKVGSRFEMGELIDGEENAGWSRIGVVGCGPGGLCDDLRAAVVTAGRRGRVVFELEIDAFNW